MFVSPPPFLFATGGLRIIFSHVKIWDVKIYDSSPQGGMAVVKCLDLFAVAVLVAVA